MLQRASANWSPQTDTRGIIYATADQRRIGPFAEVSKSLWRIFFQSIAESAINVNLLRYLQVFITAKGGVIVRHLYCFCSVQSSIKGDCNERII